MKIYFFRAGVLIIMGIFSIICVQSVSSEEIEIDFSFTEPDITEVNISDTTYHNVAMNNTTTFGFTGCPKLPVKFVKMLLPQNGTLESINITYSGNTSLGNGYNVTLGSAINQSNQSHFNSSNPYPTELCSIPYINGFRGYNILMFNLYPVHYINDTGEIYYYKNMSVMIKTNDTGSPNSLFRNLQSDENEMKLKVDDYSMVNTYTSNLTPPSETYDLLIITKGNLINTRPWWVPDNWEWNTFQTFANEKENHGIKTKIKKVEDIYTEYPEGRDPAEKIRMFIQDEYFNSQIKYVLLGGDDDIVPARLLRAKNNGGTAVPSDLYYACLDGSYDNDGDELYGEPNDGENWEEADPVDENEVGGGGFYYAEAGWDDEEDKKEKYDVSLYSPSIDLSGYEGAKLIFYGNFQWEKSDDNHRIKVNIVSGTGDPPNHLEENLLDTTVKDENTDIGSIYKLDLENLSNYDDPDNIYIEFHYYAATFFGKGSFNIDNVRIKVYDGSVWTEILNESFEEENFWYYYQHSGDGIWTQEPYMDDLDLIAEVYVGRAPVGNPREVNNFVTKTLDYEFYSDPKEEYIGHASVVGLFTSAFHSYAPPDEYNKEIIGYCDNHGYETKGIPKGSGSNEYSIDSLNDTDEPWVQKETRRDRGFPPKEFFNLVNKNRGSCGILYFLGHGGWWLNISVMAIQRPWRIRRTLHWLHKPVLSTLNYHKLSNKNYFFMYSYACKAGRFTGIKGETLAEYMTVKTNGAFAVILNSFDGWFDPDETTTDGPSQRFAREFFDAVYGENIHEIGRANQDSKEDSLYLLRMGYLENRETKKYRICYYQLNLFGDPSVSIKIPENNNPPSKPTNPQKSSQGEGWYTFSTDATDSDGDKVSYKWKWDNQECLFWTNYHNSSNTTDKTMWLPPGTHQIRVKSRDTNLDESDWSEPLNVAVPFNSNMNICSTPVVLGKQIQFYGQVLQGATLPVLTWNYSFDDGNYSNQQNTTHTYGKKGTYNVTMTVTDNASITSNVTKVVKVVILNSDFDCSSEHRSPQEAISFNDTSDGYNDITGWYWDFGDNSTNSSRNTTHEYAAEGVYNVSLNITDAGTNYSVSYQTIYIDTTDPEITSFSSDLDEVGYGYNITIIANLSDGVSGIKTATVNITYPDNTYGNFTMNNINGNIYEYVFNDTCQLGDYSYTVWAVDHAENLNSSSQGSYTVLRSFGYRKVGSSNQSILHTITGSRFMVNLKGVADNASVYIDPGNATSDFHYQCVIYRHNDSKLMGISEEKNVSSGKGWQIFNFSVPKPVLINDTEYVIGCWADYCTVKMYYDNGTGNELYYDDGSCTLQGHSFEGYYNYYPDTNNFNHEDNKYSIYCRYTPDNFAPGIINISDTPDTVGFGFNVNITTDVTDNASGVDTVKINITYPDNTYSNFTMNNNTGNSTYWYNFNETWLAGQYDYTIWTVDYAGNSNCTSGHSFNVSAQATLTIATLKDSYGANEYINLTDPPIPSDDYYLVDRGLSWNGYYNATSGRNVLEIYTTPINYQDENSNWNPIECNISLIDNSHPAYGYGYRAGNERGLYHVYFKPNAQDNWSIAFAYNKSAEPNTHVVRSKLVGVGYLDPSQNWAYEYLQSTQNSQGQIDGHSATYKDVFSGTDVVWTYDRAGLKEEIIMSNTTKMLLQNHPPSEYGLSNQHSYLVFITKLDYHNLQLYNLSGVLTGNFTTSKGIDFKDALGQFKCALPIGEAYELHDESVRQILTYRILQYNSNHYLLSGLKVTDLNDMEFPVVIDPTLTVTSSSNDGDITGDGTPYSTVQAAAEGSPIDSATTFSIGQKNDSIGPPPPPPIYFIYRGFVYFDTSSIPSNDLIDSVTLKLYKDSDFSTTDFDIVVQNGQPTYPHTPMVPGDYNKNHYSGNGGSLNTASFSNGYNNITITNHSWINTSGTTKLCLRSSRDIDSNEPTGDEYVTVCSSAADGQQPKLVVVYRNQSKIKNTGSTDIMGYLLMQVHYYNVTSGFGVAHNTINETTPRIINSSEQLALDLIFNGLVNTNNLTHGNGTYRVYAAFRDPDGNILKCNDDTELVATYEFTVTF